eukprot:gene24330-biopygen20891
MGGWAPQPCEPPPRLSLSLPPHAGLVVPGRGPGVSRGASKAAAFLGPGGRKIEKKRPCVFELRFEIRRHPDTTWHFFSISSARLASRAGPGPRQSQGSARAEAGQSVGQSSGQGAGGAWPGPRRQPRARLAPRAGPGPRQSQGSARAEAGQSVGQSHCRGEVLYGGCGAGGAHEAGGAAGSAGPAGPAGRASPAGPASSIFESWSGHHLQECRLQVSAAVNDIRPPANGVRTLAKDVGIPANGVLTPANGVRTLQTGGRGVLPIPWACRTELAGLAGPGGPGWLGRHTWHEPPHVVSFGKKILLGKSPTV